MIAGVVVCWHFELLPRWALAVLIAREVVMLVLAQAGLRVGMDLKINMVGRWAVWPVMFAIFLTLLVDSWVATRSLYIGLVLTLWATAIYLADGYALPASPQPTLKLDLTVGLYSPFSRHERNGRAAWRHLPRPRRVVRSGAEGADRAS